MNHIKDILKKFEQNIRFEYKAMSKLEFYYDHEIGEWAMKTPEENQIKLDVSEFRVCIHEYVLYEGFTDRYYYCKHCDLKDYR